MLERIIFLNNLYIIKSKNGVVLFLFFLSMILNVNAQNLEKLDKDVNKITVLLLGTKTLEGELNNQVIEIKSSNLERDTILSQIITHIQNSEQYRLNIYYEFNKEYFEGISKNMFNRNLKNAFLLFSIKGQSIYYDYFINNYQSLLSIYEYVNRINDFNISELQKCFLFNMIYDQINMGDDNFVISTFQHFIGRKPTKFELEQSLQMLNSNSSILFNQPGSSKQDYIDIIFNNSEYWQTQVSYWFKKLLYRLPTQSEMLFYIQYMHEDGTPDRLIKEILIREL